VLYDADNMFKQAAIVAALGWKLVRLWGVRDDLRCTCGKADCPTPGKHPSGGTGWQHRATDNEEEIARWFEAAKISESGRVNVGLRLGATSGVVDVEFDNDEAEKVLHEYGLHLIDTPAYASGRGVHRLFQHEDWMPDSAVIKVSGLEVRIGGGEMASQSVIPPSWHKSGKAYSWLDGRSPEEITPARLPMAFRDAIIASSRRKGSGVIAQSREALRGESAVGEGGRHAFLVGMASRQAARIKEFNDAERIELTEILLALNDRKCSPPKSDAEVVKIAADQFSHYRDRLIENRTRRPYDKFGLVWNAEGRCWEPGSWSFTVVHSDPRVYKLFIPHDTDRTQPPYVVELSSEQYLSAPKTAQRILEVTGRMNVNNPSPNRWREVWVGQSERDENGVWTNIQGLYTKLLDDGEDEYPPPEQSAKCANFQILLSFLSDFQKIESTDSEEPNASGSPRWLLREGKWELWLQWQVTMSLAWRKAGLQNPTRGERNAMLGAIKSTVAPKAIKRTAREFGDGRQVSYFVFHDEIEIAAIRRLSEGK
jgi:Bifunctional DNA primase/polymerase, N-terminal